MANQCFVSDQKKNKSLRRVATIGFHRQNTLSRIKSINNMKPLINIRKCSNDDIKKLSSPMNYSSRSNTNKIPSSNQGFNQSPGLSNKRISNNCHYSKNSLERNIPKIGSFCQPQTFSDSYQIWKSNQDLSNYKLEKIVQMIGRIDEKIDQQNRMCLRPFKHLSFKVFILN